jgi:large subunit ribosomal protein L28
VLCERSAVFCCWFCSAPALAQSHGKAWENVIIDNRTGYWRVFEYWKTPELLTKSGEKVKLRHMFNPKHHKTQADRPVMAVRETEKPPKNWYKANFDHGGWARTLVGANPLRWAARLFESIRTAKMLVRQVFVSGFGESACKNGSDGYNSVLWQLSSKGMNYMSRVCSLCGKRPAAGRSIVMKGLAKSKGGVGRKVVGISKRFFRPNIQSVRAVVNGETKRVKVCASCIRAGRIQKPA